MPAARVKKGQLRIPPFQAFCIATLLLLKTHFHSFPSVFPAFSALTNFSCATASVLQVSFRAFIAAIKHHYQRKQLGQKRVPFSNHPPFLREDRDATQGRYLEAGTETVTIEEHSLLACSLWFTQIAFLCNFLMQYLPCTGTTQQSFIKNLHCRFAYRYFLN